MWCRGIRLGLDRCVDYWFCIAHDIHSLSLSLWRYSMNGRCRVSSLSLMYFCMLCTRCASSTGVASILCLCVFIACRRPMSVVEHAKHYTEIDVLCVEGLLASHDGKRIRGTAMHLLRAQNCLETRRPAGSSAPATTTTKREREKRWKKEQKKNTNNKCRTQWIRFFPLFYFAFFFPSSSIRMLFGLQLQSAVCVCCLWRREKARLGFEFHRNSLIGHWFVGSVK